jgi:hypothetical protein
VGLVLAILRQSLEIPVEFKPSVAVAANRPSKTDIPALTHGMILFKAISI